MTSSLKYHTSKTIVLFVCTLLTANALTGMQERSYIIVHNHLLTPILAYLNYTNSFNLKTRKDECKLLPKEKSKTMVIPNEFVSKINVIRYVIESIYGIDEATLTLDSISLGISNQNRYENKPKISISRHHDDNKEEIYGIHIEENLPEKLKFSIQEESSERSLTIQNDLEISISATLYYFNQTKKLTQKEKYYLDAQQTSEKIPLPLDKEIRYLIKTFHGNHAEYDFNLTKEGENKITIKNEDHINPPSIAILHAHDRGYHISSYEKITK